MNDTQAAPGDETAQFAVNAANWWDPAGPLRTLHQINPLRLRFVRQQVGELAQRRVADIGCGGGILAEALARCGAAVVAIDLAEPLIDAARAHAQHAGVTVDYRATNLAMLAAEMEGQLDVVCCMELLEHVADPEQTITDCARLLKPGGTAAFATINRTPRAYLETVLAGEYLLNLLPRGTHTYGNYLRPSELAAACRRAGLEVTALSGMRYAPLTGHHRLTRDVGVNYLMAAVRC